MSFTTSPRFLRTLLWLDAASCLASSLLHLLAAEPLSGLLGLPMALVSASGLALCACGVLAGLLAARSPAPRRGVGLLIALNVSWSVGAIALLLGAIPEPTAIGKAYLVVQALAVGVLAELQWLGVRRVPHGPYAASAAVPRA